MEGWGEAVKVERWENPMPSYITLIRMGINKIKGKLDELYKTISGKKEKSPEEIIPKDCWELVFQNLNSEDLRSCREVCKTFNEIADLNQFKVKWKFDLVLPLLFPHLKSRSEGRSWKNLISIRMTCSSWQQSVDKYVSEVYKPRAMFPWCAATPLVTKFMDLDSIEEFLERFGESKTNPFPARTVWIRNCDNIDWENAYGGNIDEMDQAELDKRSDEIDEEQKVFQFKYIEKVGDLLEQFGKNIFKLSLNFAFEEYYYGCGALSMCKFFKRITGHLPNLQVLHVDMTSDVCEDDEQQVATFIKENRLSVLPKLETLFIGEMDKTVESYLLETYAPQLKTLALTNDHYYPLNQGHMQLFEKLQRLFQITCPEDTLGAFQFLKSPLKILRVRVKCEFMRRLSWKVDKVLRNLKHLPIEYLEISLWGWAADGVAMLETGIPVEEYINESIKTLRIEVRSIRDQDQALECNISLNFLTSLKSLETLVLKFIPVPIRPPQPTFSAPNPGLDLLECVMDEEWPEKVSYSNIWKKVPSLKTLIVERPLRGNQGENLLTEYSWKR